MTATEQAALSSSAGFLSTTRSSQHAQTDTLTDKPHTHKAALMKHKHFKADWGRFTRTIWHVTGWKIGNMPIAC